MYPNNPNRLMKDLTRKAKQYVKENKEEVLKYVIKKIIKEELDPFIQIQTTTKVHGIGSIHKKGEVPASQVSREMLRTENR